MNRITIAVLIACGLLGLASCADNNNNNSNPDKKALFFRTAGLTDFEGGEGESSNDDVTVRLTRQAQTDQTVRSLLEWIQGQYSGSKKRTRQSEPSREYLPAAPSLPAAQSKPRPFRPLPTADGSSVVTKNTDNGYPYENPQPAFPLPTGPEASPKEAIQPDIDDDSIFTNPEQNNPSEEDNERIASGFQPIPSVPPKTGFPSQPVFSSQPPKFVTQEVSRPTASQRPVRPSPSPSPSPFPPTGESVVVGQGSNEHGQGSGSGTHVHPPHIHAIEVQCGKEQMTINVEFDRAFDGVIYSKGFFSNKPNRKIASPDGKTFYNDAACRYVEPNSGKSKFSFTVSLDSCGTQFVDQFKSGGQAYLENVLVMQNEPGIQEVWDTVRRVRCLWEGSINRAVSASLELDMLSQEIVTFSGDTATARLDIQMGRGPFAPLANGLVKIGETMTLVVSVRGDAGFDIQVKDCVARDASSTNEVRLTDEQGCVLRPKLMGAFQKTRETGNTGATILAYAFFQAFKFPEIMDMTLDCNVELCKTDCEVCPNPGQSFEPSRRRRSADNYTTLGEPVRVHRTFQIVSAEDFADSVMSEEAAAVFDSAELAYGASSVCMSMPGFLLVSILLTSMLIGSSVFSVLLWFKSRSYPKTFA